MGSVVISVDAELGWGFHDLPAPPVPQVEGARDGWLALLDRFETYAIPATWAVVGHLFLEECEGIHAGYDALPEWYGRETGEWADRPDLRFGGGVVDRLLESGVPHDVGCHSFSHVVFSDPRVTPDLARTELRLATGAAAARGVESTSFVYPRNRIAHRDALAEYGFTCYRGPTNGGWTGGKTHALQPLGKLARATFPTGVPLVRPVLDEFGMVNVPPSLYLFCFDGPGRTVLDPLVGDPVTRYAKRGIETAEREDGVFHLWLHPNNLVGPSAHRRLDAILDYVRERADGGDLRVETMRDVAASVRADPRAYSSAGR